MTAALVSLVMLASAPPLTLDKLLHEVSVNAPTVGPQQESVAAAEANVGVAGAWEDPTIGVMVEDVPLHALPPEMAMHPMFTYSLTQPLDLFGRRGLQKSAATARTEQEKQALRRVSWDARAEAVKAFYELWWNQQMALVIDQQLVLLATMRDSALARYRAGQMMAHHDVLRSESELATMRAERASLEDERLGMLAMINVLRGHPRAEPIGPISLPPREPIPDLPGLLSREAQRPEVASAEQMRLEMTARLTLAKRMYLPMVMAEGFYQQRLGGEPDSVGGALMFSVPLFFWDRQRHEVDMAQAMLRRAQREVESMRAMTDAQVRVVWSRASAADRSLQALESSALPRLEETVDSDLAAYSSGQGNFLALLESAIAWRTAQAHRLQRVVTREVSRYELARLLAGPLNARVP